MRAALGGLLGEGGTALLLIAVANAVKAGEVGEGLARGDHVVGGDGRRDVGEVDLDDTGSLVLECPGSGPNRNPDLGRETLGLHERRHDAHATSLHGFLEVLEEVHGTVL